MGTNSNGLSYENLYRNSIIHCILMYLYCAQRGLRALLSLRASGGKDLIRRSQRRCRWAPAVAAAGRRRRQRGETSRGRLAGEMTATQEKNRQKRPRRQRKGRRRRRQRKERRTTRSEGGCSWGWCGHGRASQNHGRRGDNWPWWVARAASLPPQLPRALRQPWRQRANTPQHTYPQQSGPEHGHAPHGGGLRPRAQGP